MVRADAEHVNWILVVVLVALALLLAMVSSTASAGRAGLASTDREYESALRGMLSASFARPQDSMRPSREGLELPEQWTTSEVWYLACELYRAGKFEQARGALERVAAAYPQDAGARMWAGMAAYRAGDIERAVAHWEPVWQAGQSGSEERFWSGVALTAAHLETGCVDRAAQIVLRMEDESAQFADHLVAAEGGRSAPHPIVSFYAARVYEELAGEAADYRDAVEESLAERFSPALATRDATALPSPNSRSWLMFLAKRALEETLHGARTINWSAPVVPESATVEPSLAATVEELLEALGSADFAVQARGKLRALQIYKSQPDRGIEIFDDINARERQRRIA